MSYLFSFGIAGLLVWLRLAWWIMESAYDSTLRLMGRRLIVLLVFSSETGRDLNAAVENFKKKKR